MANLQADGAAEDLIRAITQLGCAEVHMKTLLEKFNAELENGIIDLDDGEAVNEQTEKISDTLDEIEAIAELRRATQLALFNLFDGDESRKDWWCLVKHESIAAYTLFEAYQASGDTELLNLYLEANKRLTKTMTRFLGAEVTDCAACFGDFLKAERSKHGG